MPVIKHYFYALVLGTGAMLCDISQAMATEKTDKVLSDKVSSEDAAQFLKEKRPVLFKLNYNVSVDYVDGILEPDIQQFFQLDPKRNSDKRLNLSGAAHLVAPLSERSLIHITGIVNWFGYERFQEYDSVTIGAQGAWFYKFNPQTYLKVSGFLSGDYFTDREFDVPTHISSSYGGRADLTRNFQTGSGLFQAILGGQVSRQTFEFATLSNQDLYQGDIAFVYHPDALPNVSVFSRFRYGQVDAFNNPFLDNEFYGVDVGFHWDVRSDLTLSVTGTYFDGDYNDPLLSPFALALQEITGTGISSELAYDVSKQLNLFGRVSYTDFDSNLPRNDFEQTIISVGARSPF